MSKKVLIAFDQALNTTGYAIFDEDGSLVAYSKFTTQGLETEEKLKEIRDMVHKIIVENKATEIAIEEIQLQNIPGSTQHGNIVTFKKLAYVQAIILELAFELELPVRVVASSTWKSYCKIKGKGRVEQKRNAQKYVLETYGIKAIQDICDSICIGKYVVENKNGCCDDIGSGEINWGE